MAHRNVTVAVTGFDGLDEPSSGPAVSRALRLGRSRSHVIGLGRSELILGAWDQQILDRICRGPAPGMDDELFLDRLLAIRAEHRFDVFLPCVDDEIEIVARLADRLGAGGIRTLVPTGTAARLLNRTHQPEFLRRADIPAPFGLIARNVDDVQRIADGVGYPLVVRSQFGRHQVAHSATQAHEIAARYLKTEPDGVVLQSFVRGESFAVAMVIDRGGACGAMAAMRTLSADAQGQIFSGALVNDAKLARAASKVAEALTWRGPLLLDFVRPHGMEEFKLRDLGGVLPVWSAVTVASGCNLAEAVFAGKAPRNRRTRAKPGAIFVRIVSERGVPIDALEQVRRSGYINGSVPRTAAAAPPARAPWAPREVRVALTGINSMDMINPGLGVARALRGMPGIEAVYGLGYGTADSGAFQADLFDRSFRLPAPGHPDELLDRLLAIHAANPFDVLIPCLDGDIPDVTRIRAELDKAGIATLLPGRRAFERRAKKALFAASTPRHWDGFSIPDSRIVRRRGEIASAVAAIGLPAAVKGEISQCIKAHTVQDAEAAWDRLTAVGNSCVIVQSFVEGEIFAVAAVCDKNHETVARLTIKKAAICAKGSTWAAVNVAMPNLERAFAAYLKRIAWVGPVEGEFIRDRFGDRCYLFEVNPRFTGWIYYSAVLGDNHPYHAVATALGATVPPPSAIAKAAFVRSMSETQVTPSALAKYAIRGEIRHA
jgi:carbamoylphosphate synthase large subunit